jgi:hypothetical protein
LHTGIYLYKPGHSINCYYGIITGSKDSCGEGICQEGYSSYKKDPDNQAIFLSENASNLASHDDYGYLEVKD